MRGRPICRLTLHSPRVGAVSESLAPSHPHGRRSVVASPTLAGHTVRRTQASGRVILDAKCSLWLVSQPRVLEQRKEALFCKCCRLYFPVSARDKSAAPSSPYQLYVHTMFAWLPSSPSPRIEASLYARG